MTTTGISNRHVTEMGYSVTLTETDGGYIVSRGGQPIRKRDGEIMVYRGLDKAVARFKKEVAAVEGHEATLRNAGVRHPIRYCACGCGTEMRMTERRYPDGRVDTVQDQIDRGERVWLVGHRDVAATREP